MKLINILSMLLLTALCFSLGACYPYEDFKNHPSQFDGSTWVSEDNEIAIFVEYIDYADFALCQKCFSYPKDSIGMRAQFIANGKSYNCFVLSTPHEGTMYFAPIDSLSKITSDEEFYENIIVEFRLIVDNSTHFMARVIESDVLEDGKLYHFYRQAVE